MNSGSAGLTLHRRWIQVTVDRVNRINQIKLEVSGLNPEELSELKSWVLSLGDDVTMPSQLESVRASESRFRQALVNALPAHVAVLDWTGRIVAVNEAWDRFARDNGGEPLSTLKGSNYLEECRRASQRGDAIAGSVLAGLESVIMGSEQRFTCEYPCNGPGIERWFVVDAVKSPEIEGVVIIHTDVSRLKVAERALQEAEKRILTEGVRDSAIFMLNSQGIVMTWNTGAQRLCGYEAREIIGKNVSCLYPEQDIERGVPGTVLKRAAEEGLIEIEGYRVRKDGTRFWASVVMTVLRDESGEVIGFAEVQRDLTELRRAREQIAFQASLLDQVRNAAVATDLEGRIVYWNQFAETLYGWKREEVLGEQIVKVNVPEESFEKALELMQGIREYGFWEGEFIVKRKNGTRFPAQVVNTQTRDESGQPTGYIGVSFDITERKKAEQALRESEERYRTVIEHSNDFIWILDLEGRFTFLNKRCEEVSGYALSELAGRSFAPLVHEEDLPAMAACFREVVGGHPRQYEARVKRADGSVFLMAANSAPIRKGDAIIGTVSFGRDITERRKAEQALRVNEERFRLVTWATNDGIWDYDLQNGQVWWNERYDELYGRRPLETRISPTWWLEQIHPEDRAGFKCHVDRSSSRRCFGTKLPFRSRRQHCSKPLADQIVIICNQNA